LQQNRTRPGSGIYCDLYAKVEMGRLYENLQNGVEDMEIFMEHIACFLAGKRD
jgi:uncharacterized protein YutE (UPF0331/DUF86 family)